MPRIARMIGGIRINLTAKAPGREVTLPALAYSRLNYFDNIVTDALSSPSATASTTILPAVAFDRMMARHNPR